MKCPVQLFSREFCCFCLPIKKKNCSCVEIQQRPLTFVATAAGDFRQVLALEPNNRQAREELKVRRVLIDNQFKYRSLEIFQLYGWLILIILAAGR
jgi:hypothetical protein